MLTYILQLLVIILKSIDNLNNNYFNQTFHILNILIVNDTIKYLIYK